MANSEGAPAALNFVQEITSPYGLILIRESAIIFPSESICLCGQIIPSWFWAINDSLDSSVSSYCCSDTYAP